MDTQLTRRLALPLLTVLAGILAGCGGGGSSPAPAIEENAVTVGTITRFGSVVTNDVIWQVDHARVQIDGVRGGLTDLGVGDVVAITGDLDDTRLAGIASRIELRHAVQGPITAIDRFGAGGSSGFSSELVIEVLGQWIVLDNSTIYGPEIVPAKPEGLAVGDTVSITGFPGTVLVGFTPPELGFSVFSNVHVWRARRIEKRSRPVPLIVSGVVRDVDSAARRFRVGELSVDYAGVAPVPSADTVAGNARLWVRGKRTGPAGELLATEVLKVSSPVEGLATGAWVDVEGRFENRAELPFGATDIEVGGVPMDLATLLEPGNGQIFRAQGLLGENGRVAGAPVSTLTCEAFPANLRLRAPVDSVDVAGAALVIMGQRIEITTATQFHDRRGSRRQQVSLGDLVAGEWLDVRACERSWFILGEVIDEGPEPRPVEVVSEWVATTVERLDPSATVEFAGRTGVLSEGELVMRQFPPSPALVIKVDGDTVFFRGSRPPYAPEADPVACLGLAPGGAVLLGLGPVFTAVGPYSVSGVITATEVRIRGCTSDRP